MAETTALTCSVTAASSQRETYLYTVGTRGWPWRAPGAPPAFPLLVSVVLRLSVGTIQAMVLTSADLTDANLEGAEWGYGD
ncbi:uncharacterized protein YjbI with pentapeptide repeats [Nocardiopsis aegyptia]|uniref:Uncharacterized protein YjbI with pentapeptide repeats n=1 Tax=Nocardiopsis aegyptia TaxID=220378 RepID=A0A7Z0J8B9_9ACTN|nr:uncharacterized protein YjbI with pentapeptide repeats [Nocardiopsis aegyptia]